jgi:hypothetical protein
MLAWPKPERPPKSTAASRRYMGEVKSLPCVICQAPPPSVAHHCIHGRFSQRRASDYDTIPLCWGHHDAASPIGLHTDKRRWRYQYGPDTGYIDRTRKALGYTGGSE